MNKLNSYSAQNMCLELYKGKVLLWENLYWSHEKDCVTVGRCRVYYKSNQIAECPVNKFLLVLNVREGLILVTEKQFVSLKVLVCEILVSSVV